MDYSRKDKTFVAISWAADRCVFESHGNGIFQTAARIKELIRALYFAVGPFLVQLPFVANLVLMQVLRTLMRTERFSYTQRRIRSTRMFA